MLYLVSFLWAQETDTEVLKQIDEAYQLEFAYLAAERESLKEQLARLDSRPMVELENSILQLESQLAAQRLARKEAEESLLRLEDRHAKQEEQSLALDSVLLQGAELYGLDGTDRYAKLQQLFTLSIADIEQSGQIQTETKKIIDVSGVEREASVVQIGQIAAFSGQNALRPAGDGYFQEVPDWGVQDKAKGELFLVEGFSKRVEETPEKTWKETLEAGGLVAYIIAGLGFLGLALAAARVLHLHRARRDPLEENFRQLTTSEVEEPLVGIRSQGLWELNQCEDVESLNDSADAILLQQKQALSIFGGAILVIAAVAPLLGLLGTVSGMISTFGIITEHGTGDPKLLSGGISEALITTQLGLMVAIPMVLLGNVLNGWAQSIFSNSEQIFLRFLAWKLKEGVRA
ncbi:MAG: MotA/TolQ/ExbB proton channel family protein [Myxococcota bacterium]|nr:MotA/TolQ/ExbB proton channel family protein [Myxococcota bacterium]